MSITLRWWTPGQDQEFTNRQWIVHEGHPSKYRWIPLCCSSSRRRPSFSRTWPTPWQTCKLKLTTHRCSSRRPATSTSSCVTIAPCSLMLLIRLKLRIGWRCSPPVSVMTERRSYMLQDDFRGLHPLGVRIPLLMPPQTLSPGTSSPPTSGATIYPPSHEDQKEGVPFSQAGWNVRG
jgi:hypothetical protein